MLLAPLVSFDAIEKDELNRCLVAWGHKMGPWERPTFRGWFHGLRHDGQLVAVLATGFVLFTLLVNGLTLRPVIHLLQLNRLSPLNEALRCKVLALSLTDVRDAVRQSARNYHIDSSAARSVASRRRRWSCARCGKAWWRPRAPCLPWQTAEIPRRCRPCWST